MKLNEVIFEILTHQEKVPLQYQGYYEFQAQLQSSN